MRNHVNLCMQVCLIDGTSFTDLQWFPVGSRKQQGAGGVDLFAVACTDGESTASTHARGLLEAIRRVHNT